MSGGGWAMMIFSWLFIGTLSLFCTIKVISLAEGKEKHIKPIEEIDTGDKNGD